MAFGSVNIGPENGSNKYVSIGQVGVPGGVATLGADGVLSASQRPVIDAYTKQEAQDVIDQKISSHDNNEQAHGPILSELAAIKAQVNTLELKFGTDITKNPFTVTFVTLVGVNTTGVWNAPQGRIEF